MYRIVPNYAKSYQMCNRTTTGVGPSILIYGIGCPTISARRSADGVFCNFNLTLNTGTLIRPWTWTRDKHCGHEMQFNRRSSGGYIPFCITNAILVDTSGTRSHYHNFINNYMIN
ncbi:hypothetical protein QTP88_009136 [Uroleucon formosanum]